MLIWHLIDNCFSLMARRMTRNTKKEYQKHDSPSLVPPYNLFNHPIRILKLSLILAHLRNLRRIQCIDNPFFPFPPNPVQLIQQKLNLRLTQLLTSFFLSKLLGVGVSLLRYPQIMLWQEFSVARAEVNVFVLRWGFYFQLPCVDWRFLLVFVDFVKASDTVVF